MIRIVLFIAFSSALSVARSQGVNAIRPGAGSDKSNTNALIQWCEDSLVWIPSKLLPPGAHSAVLEGDPTKEGIFTTRLKLPPNYVLPPHTHPKDERITVLSGTIYLGFGDEVDEKVAKAFGPGCYYVNPTGLHHFIFTKTEAAEVQLTGPGPWGIDFLRR